MSLCVTAASSNFDWEECSLTAREEVAMVPPEAGAPAECGGGARRAAAAGGGAVLLRGWRLPAVAAWIALVAFATDGEGKRSGRLRFRFRTSAALCAVAAIAARIGMGGRAVSIREGPIALGPAHV